MRRITVNNDTTKWSMVYYPPALRGAPEGMSDSEALARVLAEAEPGDYFVVVFENFELERIVQCDT